MLNTEKIFRFSFKVKEKYNEQSVKGRIFYPADFNDDKPSDSIIYGQLEKAFKGDTFEAKGKFCLKENGYYIKLMNIPSLTLPKTKEEIAEYVASQINGITKKTAYKVVDTLGEGFIPKVLNDNSILDGLLKKSQKEKMVEWCNNHSHLDSSVVKLLNEGFTPRTAYKLYSKYGESTIYRLEKDPYEVYLEGNATFKEIDDFAKKNHLAGKRLEAGIMDFVRANEENGNMAVIPYCQEINSHIHGRYKKEEISNAINELCRRGVITKYARNNSRFIITPVNLSSEKTILAYTLQNHRTDIDEQEILNLLSTDTRMKQKQREAVAKCMSWHLSILTGGPGTGKTWTLQRLVDTIKRVRKNDRIALMAPTGKASARMSEFFSKKEQAATTIHAALALNAEDDLNLKDGITLDVEWIIIDECSMIDEKLFAYFIRHISPYTHVILCGDEQQLPSVQAGNLLFELLHMGVPSTTLNEMQRTKSTAINLNANKIREGRNDFIFNNEFRFIDCDDTKVTDEVSSLYQELLKTNSPEDILILSPIKEGLTGVNNINSKLQEDINKNTEKLIIKDKVFKLNDRVIQLKNNHKLNIHNGDIGTVIELKEKSVVVLFDGNEEPIEITDIEHLQLAYAITVHKSQGSEAKNIIMVFSRENGAEYMLKRKLVYTALTRAKEKFFGIGSRQSFLLGSLNTKGEERLSLLRNLYEEAQK